jgi:hypothetical protein
MDTRVLILAVASGFYAFFAFADDQLEYERRAAARYSELFQSLDRNSDRTVTREEARGDLNFAPQFDDMDVNRDGIVTVQELADYVASRYNQRLPLPASRGSSAR